VNFVLDASVTLSWLLEDAGAGQAYAVTVFDALTASDVAAHVPVTWGLEIANVTAKSEVRGIVLPNRSQAFISALTAAPIVCDQQSHAFALNNTLNLARRYKLSAYDASYLELALRLSVPLATLDAELRRAADKAGVRAYKPT
jgi:predicted nucleic acid-binding protein